MKHVPNHDKVPFNEMTPDERSAIIEAALSHGVEWWNSKWVFVEKQQLLSFKYIYRTVSKKLVIPWGVIKPEYKWAAVNDDGFVTIATSKLVPRNDGVWVCMDGKMADVVALNIDTTGIGWRDSLVQRPEGV